MIKHQKKSKEILFNELASKIMEGKQWQIVNSVMENCLFKQRWSNRIFKLIYKTNQIQSQKILINIEKDQQQIKYQDILKDNIFLHVLQVSEQYYLYQRFIINLHKKIFITHSYLPRMIFTQDQILRTFYPILKALTLNLIPSFYQINSQNIVVDSNQNIRLCNPLFLSNNHHNDMNSQHDLYTQMAIVLIEASLLVSKHQSQKIIQDQEKLVGLLAERCFSVRIIGLIVILINQKNRRLPINLKECLESEYSGPWFEMIANRISEIPTLHKKQVTEMSTQDRTASKTVRRRFIGQDDETEDSQNHTLAKYRNGKRVNVNKLVNWEKIQNAGNEIGGKGRKDKYN